MCVDINVYGDLTMTKQVSYMPDTKFRAISNTNVSFGAIAQALDWTDFAEQEVIDIFEELAGGCDDASFESMEDVENFIGADLWCIRVGAVASHMAANYDQTSMVLFMSMLFNNRIGLHEHSGGNDVVPYCNHWLDIKDDKVFAQLVNFVDNP